MILLAYQGVSPLSRLIRWQTRSIYSHIAISHEGQVVEALGTRGRVVLAENYRQYHTPGTVVDVLDVPGVDPDLAWDFALEQVGKPYDYRAIVKFVTRRPATENGRWFCSELASAACSAGGVELLRIPHHESSPRDVVASPAVREVATWATF